eukprot:jgi/Botrbrau1/19702/Bobra.0003s0063.1
MAEPGRDYGLAPSSPQPSLEAAQASALQSLREFVQAQGGTLPDGYTAVVKIRKAGVTQGGTDTYFFGPDGKRCRSKTEVLRNLGISVPTPSKGPSRTDRKTPKDSKLSQGNNTAQKTAKAQLLTRLQDYIKEIGGDLGKGWQVDVRLRNSGSRAGAYDAHYVSPEGHTYRSRLAVARALGLTTDGPSAPSEDIDMPDHDVAALLMEIYQKEAQRKLQKRKKTKKGEEASNVSMSLTPKVRTPPAGSGPPDTSGLTTIADALAQMSPGEPTALSSDQKMSEGKGIKQQQENGHLETPASTPASPKPSKRKQQQVNGKRHNKEVMQLDQGLIQESSGKRPRREKAKNQINFGVLEAAAKQEYAFLQEEEKKKARKARRQAAKDNCGSAFSKLLGRVRGQISRIRQEELLINTYAADGWKGSNREKFKPMAEIERAHIQIEKSREVIREAVKYCEDSEGDRPIAHELFDNDGEIDEEHICCSRCGLLDCEDGNDIVLCDGNCNRAYHEKCVVPPFNAADLEEEEGWLCPGCDTKVDILNVLNEEFGTEYELSTPWHQVLAHNVERAAEGEPTVAQAPAGGPGSGIYADLLHGHDLPESDPEDSDFREDKSDVEADAKRVAPANRVTSNATGTDESDDDEASVSEDGDESEQGSALDAKDEIDDSVEVLGRRTRGQTLRANTAKEGDSGAAVPEKYTRPELDADAVVLIGKRKRPAVDYLLLNAVMFGDGDFVEDEGSDEDFAVNENDLQRLNSG